MPVTLQQIADQAGVTRSQVSRVLNGRYKENRPAIARKADSIRKIAQDLGYRPNLAARSVTTGKFGQVAFVTCGDLGFDWFAPDLLHGIHEGLEAGGSRLVINELDGARLSDPEQLPRLFRESAVDGMLVNIDAKLPDRVVELFDALPVPIVLLNEKRATRSVYPDEIEGGRKAAEYLLGRGMKKIGFIYLQEAQRAPHFSRQDRAEGFRQAMDEAGRSPEHVLLGSLDYRAREGNGAKLVGDFLDRNPGLEGVICYSLPSSGAVQLAAAERGIKKPEDLRTVVFSHQVAHATTGMPMDTIIVPFKEMGLRAVEMMNGMDFERDAIRPPSVQVGYRQLYVADDKTMLDVSDSDAAPHGSNL